MFEKRSDGSDPVEDAMATRNARDFLGAMQPHLRRMVAEVDANTVFAFDAVFLSAAVTEAKSAGRPEPTPSPAMPVGQEFGLKTVGEFLILPFLINVMATIATTRAQNEGLGPWRSATHATTVGMSAADYFEVRLSQAKLSDRDRAAMRRLVAEDPVLSRVMRGTQLTMVRQ